MDSHSAPPDINIEPEHCPEAVKEWYRLTGLQDRKESAGRKDLALKAKQHLLFLGWKFWYVDKKGRWELRYTSPNNGKNYISLRKACESCIEEGGCSPEHPSTAAPAAATTAISSSSLQLKKRTRESKETAPTTISLSSLQSKKLPRESEEAVARAFYLSPFHSKDRPRETEEAATTLIYSSPLQSKERPRKSEEASVRSIYWSPLQSKERTRQSEDATETINSSSALQLKEQPRNSVEAEAEAAPISLSPLQSKKRLSESEDAAAIAISLTPLQLKKRLRESEEVNESTSDEDSKPSSYSYVKKAVVTAVSTSTENEKHVSQLESEVTNSVGSGRRAKVLKSSIMEKNSEGCGKRGKVLKREGIRERYSLVSWLIKNQVLVSGTNVFCRGSNNVVTRGSIFCDGIVCDCCNINFTAIGFEAHAGCTRHRPSTSILLEDGRSLLECQGEVLSWRYQNGNHCIAEANYEANNDTVCSICGLGGDIVLCDRCPSAFHLSCLGLDRVPNGDWFCPTCCCKICYRPKCKQECADDTNNNILVCVQCEQKFHFGCVKTIGFVSSHMESNVKKKNWFCGAVCGNMFLCLKKLLGKPIKIADNLTWTLLKNNVSSDDGGDFTSNECSRKLTVALGILYETFNPTIDALSGTELIKDVVFSRESEHKRLNFRGFYNVVLEKMGEVISVATLRIYGQKVVEIVFVATKKQHRRRGMCRLLMDELEKQLTRLGVRSMVLHSSEDAIDTWTKSFGFDRMTGKYKCQFVANTFLEFENSIMCLKPLNRPVWHCTA